MNHKSDRLHFIDCARTYAIFLALLSHALLTTGVFKALGDDVVYIRQFTRMATPMFVFMFGFMIELVYVRKSIANGLGSVRGRLYIRAFQCYVAYCLTSLCAVIGDYRSMSEFLDSLVFLGGSRFGNILRVYAVIMLMTPLLISMRLRFGVRFLPVLLLCLFLSFPLLSQLKSLDFGLFNVPVNILFGIGTEEGGPSTLHSMSFVLAGMLMAASLNDRGAAVGRNFARFYFCAALLVSGSMLLWIFLLEDGFIKGWFAFAGSTYRNLNMPGYFLIGTITSVMAITLFSLIVGVRTPPWLVRLFLPLGMSSLLSYTAGNMILNLLGKLSPSTGPTLFLLLFFSIVLIITRYLKHMPFYRLANDLMNFRSVRI